MQRARDSALHITRLFYGASLATGGASIPNDHSWKGTHVIQIICILLALITDAPEIDPAPAHASATYLVGEHG